jgi:thioredoxin reductase
MDVLDIFIIGGGPIGLACGIQAQKAGLSYVIVEKGCLVNSLYNYPQNMTFFLHRKNWRSVLFHLFQTIPSLPVQKRWNITEG